MLFSILLFFSSCCFQIRLMSVAVQWSTSAVRPVKLYCNEPVKCALEGCNAIYYACMKCTNTMKLCTTDMIQFSQVSCMHSVIHFKCSFCWRPAKWCCCLMVHSWTWETHLKRSPVHWVTRTFNFVCKLQMSCKSFGYLQYISNKIGYFCSKRYY